MAVKLKRGIQIRISLRVGARQKKRRQGVVGKTTGRSRRLKEGGSLDPDVGVELIYCWHKKGVSQKTSYDRVEACEQSI